MSDIWLSKDDVQRLTGARWRKVQAKRLADMGIPFRLSATGEPLVERSAVVTQPRQKAAWQPKWMRNQEPNWDALDSSQRKSKKT